VVVVGGGLVVVVVGGAVVGGAVVGGAVAGGDVVTGVDLVTGGAVVEVELAAPVPIDVVGAAGIGVAGVAAPDPEGDVVEVDFGADDFPSERTANQALSTPCPVASPFLVSLTKR
jgi:hypothetical protein